MRVRVPRSAKLARFVLMPAGRILVIGLALLVVLGLGVFTYFYSHYSRMIDEKLRAGPFAQTAKLYAAPQSVAVGDAMTPGQVAAELRRSGYNESRGNPTGYYQLHPNAIEVFPGPDSYFDQEAAVVKFSSGRIAEVVSLQDNTPRSQY